MRIPGMKSGRVTFGSIGDGTVKIESEMSVLGGLLTFTATKVMGPAERDQFWETLKTARSHDEPPDDVPNLPRDKKPRP
jgi:hypothetical protein